VIETDRKAAEKLAQEVRTASGGPRTWRRVASLLEMFGVERLSDDVRERIATALADVRIEVQPPLETVAPDQVVQLSLPDTETMWVQAAAAGDGGPPLIRRTDWGLRAVSTERTLDEPRVDGETAWFTVDHRRAESEPTLSELWPFCRGELTREMVDDVLDADARPGVRFYGVDREVRLVTVFSVEPIEPEAAATGSRAGSLRFRTLRLLAGRDWLITSWDGDIPAGAAAVQRRLEQFDRAPTPGDLGINLAYGLATTYPSSERRLYEWLGEWESDFHRHLEGTGELSLATLEKATLIDLRRLLGELRSRLHAFEQPGLKSDDAWFTRVRDREIALRVRQLVTASLGELAELDNALRTSLDLLATSSSAEQLAATREQAAQGDRLNRQVALITSVLLVPTFLAEVFGTKPFPGDEGWTEFLLMIASMVVLGAITYQVLTRRSR
jgi:hypothetical protein